MNSLLLTLANDAGPLQKLVFGERAASSMAQDTDRVFFGILLFDVFWFVLLMGLMFYWVVKYRRRRGVPPQRTAHHNTRLELVWTIVPSVFLGAMFYYGFNGYLTKLVAPTDAEVIDVVGQKWEWVITYKNGTSPDDKTTVGGNTRAPIILVPVGRPVQFRITSIDVLHSFWIPDFRFKFDAMPNRYTSFWVQAEEPGDHEVYCAEYCGDRHSEMSAILRAVPADQYDATLDQWFNSTAGLSPVERGKHLVETRGGCIACHSVNGNPGVGPTWKNAWGYEADLADGTSIPEGDAEAWLNYVVQSIKEPNAKVRSGFPSPSPMTSYAGVFSDQELRFIAAYIESLSDRGAPAEGEAPAQQ